MSQTPEPIGGVTSIHGTTIANIYAVTFNEVLHFDGILWTGMDDGPTADIETVWASDTGDVWVSGNKFHHYRGSQ